MRVRISRRAASINESRTLRVLERSRRLRMAGDYVVNLAAGENGPLLVRQRSPSEGLWVLGLGRLCCYWLE